MRSRHDSPRRVSIGVIGAGGMGGVQSLQAGVATGPSAWDGYASMLVADACIASARCGQPVDVEMPAMAGMYQRA